MSMAFSVSDVSPAMALRLAMRASICLEEIAAIKAIPAWQRDAESSLSDQLATILRTVAEQVIEELITSGRVPGDDLARKILLRYLEDAGGQIAETTAAAAQSAAQHGRDKVVADVRSAAARGAGSTAGSTPISTTVSTVSNIAFGAFPEHTRNLIRDKVFEASERTVQRITGNVMENLTRSYEDGVGIDEAARRLREVFTDMESHELKRVARTEIISAQNEGTYLTEQELGIEYHEWISAQDDRTRESHLEMHGQITRVGDYFSIGLLYPGDFDSGVDLSEIINCRCRVAAYLMPEGKIAPPSDWFYESDLIDIVEAT